MTNTVELRRQWAKSAHKRKGVKQLDNGINFIVHGKAFKVRMGGCWEMGLAVLHWKGANWV